MVQESTYCIVLYICNLVKIQYTVISGNVRNLVVFNLVAFAITFPFAFAFAERRLILPPSRNSHDGVCCCHYYHR